MEDSVDAATVARWLNCSPRMVRQYAEEGLAVRTRPGRFDLERSVGNVVLHLRELAASRKGADGADVVKASAALKDVQRRLAELKYAGSTIVSSAHSTRLSDGVLNRRRVRVLRPASRPCSMSPR
jgi:phage terminase Nu1 subunit (DNA packaging protein)